MAVAYSKGKGYSSGNITDKIKHPNLELMARLTRPIAYVEFHSGEGKYGDYDGSSVRVLGIMKEVHNRFISYLHEIDGKRRKKLRKNVSSFGLGNTLVRKDWKMHVDQYVQEADDSFLFLIDPSYMEEYYEDDGILGWLGKLASTGANMFLYAPQTLRVEKDEETVKKIKFIVSGAGREGIDLMHPNLKGGHHARIDHNIIIGEKETLGEICESHIKNCERYSQKYKRFREFENWYSFI